MARNNSLEAFFRLGVAGAMLVGLSGCGAPSGNEDDKVIIGGPAIESCIDTGETSLLTAGNYEFPVPNEVCGLLLSQSDQRIVYMRIGPEWVQVVVNTVGEGLSIAARGELPVSGHPFGFTTEDVSGVLIVNGRGNLELAIR